MSEGSFWLSRDEAREIDRRAMTEFGVPGIVLMENAGRGCAELLMRLNPRQKPTIILCGPGNNGGDGFVIARHLHTNGWRPSVWFIARPSKLTGDALLSFDRMKAEHVTLLDGTLTWDHPELAVNWAKIVVKPSTWIVDAMFGTGLTRALETPYADIIEIINGSGAPVLAVDIPSGLDCDSGESLGPTVRATHTATFVAHKKGFTNPKSREWTGKVHVVDIGVPTELVNEFRRRRSG